MLREKKQQTYERTMDNGDTAKAMGKGAVDIRAVVNGKWKKLTLGDVWYVPKIQKNLFSVLAGTR